MKPIIRALAICAVLLSGSGLTAAGTEYTYVVVLNGSADSAEPDIPALGGEVLHRSQNRRVIRISASGIRALAAHRGVKYIQRVQVDDSVPPLPHAPRVAATAVEINSSPAPTWYSGEYIYDGDGNITAIGTAANQSSDGGTESFLYDSASRLLKATIDDGSAVWERYTYDSFGNRIDTTASVGGLSTATPVSAATNRLTNVTYDSVGNAVTQGGSTTYVYDGLNMLRAKVKSTETATYVYTADDERVGVFENGEQRWMIRDLSNKVLREWEVTGSVWMWREDHMYRNGVLAAGERETAEGGTRHFHLDHLGTPRLITDANAARIAAHDYFPFGIEITDLRQEMIDRGTTRPETMAFTGHERDFSGGTGTNNWNTLDYMHARYYSSVWGRFLSVDPVLGEPADPQSWNRYTYVADNPIRNIDPKGLQAVPGSSMFGSERCKILCADKPKPEPKPEQEQTASEGKTPTTSSAFEDVNEFYRHNMPMFYVPEELVFFTSLPITAAAPLQLTHEHGIMLLNTRFEGNDLTPFDRFDLASAIAHERMHYLFSGWVSRGAGRGPFGASLFVALLDGFTKRNPFDASEYTKLHTEIDRIGNQAGRAYCRNANARGIPCQTP